MKRTERFTHAVLIILAILSIVAITLQIINTETGLIETAYEIITFFVAAVALTLSVLQGISNARTTNELREITKNINHVQAMEKTDLARSSRIAKEIEETLERHDAESSKNRAVPNKPNSK